jgi:hypothetical protein
MRAAPRLPRFVPVRALLLAPLLLLPLLVGGCAQDDDAAPAESSSRGAARSATPTTATPTAAAPTEAAATPDGGSSVPAPTASASGGAKPSAITNCGGPTLDLSIASRDSGAGHIDYTIAFTNRGRTACRVSGAPRAYLIDRNGDQLGREADGTGAEGPFVRLAPGRSATTVVQVVNVGTDGGPLGDTCTPEQGVAIAIDAPNYDRYEQLPADVRGCRETDVSFLAVGVLRPAS